MSDYSLPIGLFLFTALLFGFMLFAAFEEKKQWDKFAAEHACKAVEKKAGYNVTTTVVGGDGKVGIGSSYVPAQTGYLCDDGVTYWR